MKRKVFSSLLTCTWHRASLTSHQIMTQIFQNNFRQDWVCTLIKHHAVLFTLNFNSTSDRDLGCSHMQRQFLPHYDQMRVEPFTEQYTGTHVIWVPEQLGLVEQTIHPPFLGQAGNFFVAETSIILACAGDHWDTGPNKAEIAGMGAGGKASRLEALCSHIVLTLHPNASYGVQQWLDTLHWNIINPHYWAHWNHSCAPEQVRVSVDWKT